MALGFVLLGLFSVNGKQHFSVLCFMETTNERGMGARRKLQI